MNRLRACQLEDYSTEVKLSVSHRSADCKPGKPGKPGKPTQPSNASAFDTIDQGRVNDLFYNDRLPEPAASSVNNGSVASRTNDSGLQVYCIHFIKLLLVQVYKSSNHRFRSSIQHSQGPSSRPSTITLLLERRVTAAVLPQDNVPGSGLVLGAVQHKLSADDLDLALSTELLNLLLEAERLPDLVEDGGDDEAVGLGDADQLVEALGADVAGGEGADAGGDVVGAGQGVDGVGEVGRLELVVGAGVAGDVQHAGAEVDAVDLLGAELGQVDADEAGAAAGVEDLDRGGDEVAFAVAGGEVLADGLGDEGRGLVLLAVNHVVVVGLGPVIIQLGHLLDVQFTIRTSQVRVVTVDVLIRVRGGGGGRHDWVVAVGFVALDSLEVALERDGALGCWCYGMEQMAFREEMLLGGLLLWGCR
jgi:hypothetical protein